MKPSPRPSPSNPSNKVRSGIFMARAPSMTTVRIRLCHEHRQSPILRGASRLADSAGLSSETCCLLRRFDRGGRLTAAQAGSRQPDPAQEF
jgi:hypothetical protein